MDFNGSVQEVVLALEDEGGYGRVVAHLLGVELVAADLGLEGFADCRVEWLLDVVELDRQAHSDSVDGFKSVDRLFVGVLLHDDGNGA